MERKFGLVHSFRAVWAVRHVLGIVVGVLVFVLRILLKLVLLRSMILGLRLRLFLIWSLIMGSIIVSVWVGRMVLWVLLLMGVLVCLDGSAKRHLIVVVVD